MSTIKPGKAVLQMAAGDNDGKPFEPWFRNREKLIRSALRDDYIGRSLKRLIRKLIVDIASKDEEFRTELAKDLVEIAKGKSRRPKIYPDWFANLIFDEVKAWKEAGSVKTLPEAFERSAEIHKNDFPEITENAVRGIYQRKLSVSKKHKTE